MSANNSSDLSCFEKYDNRGFVAVVAIRATGGAISLVCCVAMILLIVLFKKYKFFTQRLILYLAIATLAYSVVSIINVEGFRSYRVESLRGYCVFAGFLEQLMSCWVPIAITCIVVDLFFKVVINRPTERLEIPYLLLTFASPLLYSWIPFIYLAYGQAGAWCWIRDKNYKDCSDFRFGTALRFTIFWVPLYLLMFLLVIMLVVVFVILRKRQREWVGNFDPDVKELKKRMQKEVLPLIAYPIIFLVLNIFPFVNRIANIVESDPILPLWILAALSIPFQGPVITIAFVIDPETRSLLTGRRLVGAVRNFWSDIGNVEEYPLGGNGKHQKEREIELSN